MRIEDINKASLGSAEDGDLYNLRLRTVQLYEKNFQGNSKKTAMGLRRDDLIEKYRSLREEMKKRKLRIWKEAAIDRVTFKKAMMGIDVPSLGNIVITPNFAVITGPFIRSPKTANEMDVVIREEPHKKDERIESLIQSVLQMATEKGTRFTYKQMGADGAHIPVFDLILRPKNETRRINRQWPYDSEAAISKEEGKKKIQISKPEETDNTIRIPVGDGCDVTATITIDAGQGIKALYCGKVKKIRTYLFDKKKKVWTMASARAWIKEHKEKINKKLDEENLETFEYLIHHVSVEGDEEIIHHCHMYDHIGNLFEQVHLWIDKGKIYLDGKQIKEGHFHVIKGLEETQEVAWSEQEATDAGIKPKGMMSGMTLKEKAKVW
jgi:hypothetical protein